MEKKDKLVHQLYSGGILFQSPEAVQYYLTAFEKEVLAEAMKIAPEECLQDDAHEKASARLAKAISDGNRDATIPLVAMVFSRDSIEKALSTPE